MGTLAGGLLFLALAVVLIARAGRRRLALESARGLAIAVAASSAASAAAQAPGRIATTAARARRQPLFFNGKRDRRPSRRQDDRDR